jgi:hypothetical protein
VPSRGAIIIAVKRVNLAQHTFAFDSRTGRGPAPGGPRLYTYHKFPMTSRPAAQLVDSAEIEREVVSEAVLKACAYSSALGFDEVLPSFDQWDAEFLTQLVAKVSSASPQVTNFKFSA